MYIPLPDLDLRFLDFAILALLLSVLYGLSALEFVMASSGGKKMTDVDEIDLHKAITWAFLGILATLVAGVLANVPQLAPLNAPLVIIPLVFISQWALFHFRKSRLVQVGLVQAELDAHYKDAIFKYVKNSTEPVNALEVYEHCAEARNYSQIFRYMSYTIGNRAISVTLEDLVQKLIFTEKKVADLLDGLVKESKLVKMENGYQAVKS